MKHLKRFYENVNDELDIEYIKHCFADLSDDPECSVEYETHETEPFNSYLLVSGEEYVSIYIYIPNITKCRSLEKIVENSERISLVVKSIDIAIKRLKDEYPSYKIGIGFEETEDLIINITK